MDASRVILQGTCRRVSSGTGAATLLKTREFGVGLSLQQRRAAELQLGDSRILVHIAIRGVHELAVQRPHKETLSPLVSPRGRYPPAYFLSPLFLS